MRSAEPVRMYVPGEDEYVKAWMGPLEPTSCVSGMEGKLELYVGLIARFAALSGYILELVKRADRVGKEDRKERQVDGDKLGVGLREFDRRQNDQSSLAPRYIGA